MSKKTILYLRTDLVGQKLVAGGSVSHTVGVINGFKELGYSVVCASSCMETILQELKLQEFMILRLPQWLSILRWKLSSLVSNVFFLVQVVPLTKRYQFEFVYQRYSILNCVGVLIQKLKGIPLILEYNGSEVWVDKHWSQGRWFKLSWLISWIETINIRSASMIVVVSQTLKDDLVSRGIEPTKILVNPNGVDSTLYDPIQLASERYEIRKKLGIEDTFVFGFIGTFSQWHGIEMLADMIPKVREHTKSVHFLLIGDGPLKEFLQDRLSSLSTQGVTFIDTIPSLQARAYLAACDAFLCPTQPNADGSPFFGSPTKIFEYMSMGKPIIASNVGQLCEVLHPAIRLNEDAGQGIGFLMEPTSDEFMQAIQNLLQLNDEQRAQIGDNARKKVLERYTWIHHVQKIVQGFYEAH